MKTTIGKERSRLLIFWALLIGIFSISNTFAQAQTPQDAVVDFNGDGKTDFSIIRSAGFGTPITWWTLESGTGNVTIFDLGVRAIDQPVPADYDGDGKDDIAVYRFTGPEAGNWYIFQSSTGTYRIEQFGIARDNPTVVDDYDGDGKDDLAVFRVSASTPGQAYFFYKGSLNNPQGNITYVPWGMRWGTQSSDVDDPYTGDFDGDGKADFGVQRKIDLTTTTNSPAFFWVLLSSGGQKIEFFGLKDDRVVPGDYDGDGKTDFAVARGFNISPGSTTWYIRHSSGLPDFTTTFGSGFNFAQGDYDGDGKTDIGYFMLGETAEDIGFWYLASATNNESRFVRWGARPTFPSPGAGDLPVAGYNNR